MLQLLSQFLILALLLSFSPAQALAVLAGEEDGSPSAEATACWALKFADGNMTVNADGTCSIADAGGAGAGDIDAIGDVTSGSAFTGTQGTSLTFYNASGNSTFSYNGSNFALGAGKGLTWNSAGSSLGSSGTIALAAGTTTGSQLAVTSNSLTSGTGILSTSSSASMTGRMLRAIYTGASSGNAIEAQITSASASGVALQIDQYGLGNALTINDVSGDTTPLTVDADGALGVGGLITGNAGIASKNGATSAGYLSIYEDSDDGSNYTRFQAQAQAGDITYVLPPDDGDAGEQLQTDGSGNLTWEAAGAGGSGDSISVNSSAAADANFLDGDIDWTLNAASTPDDITATVACTGCIDATDMAADSVGESELIESMNFVATGGWDYGGATLEVPNSTSLPGTCTVGQVYMDTDATTGQRIYACESTNTWALQGDGGGAGGAPSTVNYLVGTADAGLSAEIVVGTTPGGELGGTWDSPTIDDSLAVTSWNLTTPTITTSATVTDDDWIGLGSSAALIQFDDQATDEIEILNANVRIGAGSASYPPATKLEAVGSNPGSGVGTEDVLKLIRPTYALEYSKVAAFKLGKWNSANLTSSSRLDIALKNGASGTYDADVTVMSVLSSGKVGIGTTAPDKGLEINDPSGGNLRLTYNDSNGSAATYTDMSVDSSGDLTLGPSGGDVTSTGTILSSATGSLGWSIVSAANQACTTTCTSAAVFGWDTSSGEVAVSATDATADKCLCAGAS